MTTIRYHTTLPSPGDSFNVLLGKFGQIIADEYLAEDSRPRLGDGDYLRVWRILETAAEVNRPITFETFYTLLSKFKRAVGLSSFIPSDGDYRWLWKTLVAYNALI